MLALNLYVDASNGANAIGALNNLYNSQPYSTQQGPEPLPQKRPIVLTEFSYHADANVVTAENWGDETTAGWDHCYPGLADNERCKHCPDPGLVEPCSFAYPNVVHDPARGTAYSQYVDGVVTHAKGNGNPILPPQGRANFVAGYCWYSLYDHEAEKEFDPTFYHYGSTTLGMQNWGLLKLRTNAPAPSLVRGGAARALAASLFLLATAGGSDRSVARVLSVPSPYPTIQDAADRASSGDTVAVSPGTYREGIEVYDKSLSIIGIGGAAETVIWPPEAGVRALRIDCDTPQPVELSGLTIRNSSARNIGYGAAFVTAKKATISSCVFLENCAIRSVCNSCPSGAVGAAKVIAELGVRISDCLFIGNRAGVGGAVGLHTNRAEIFGNSFVENIGKAQAGALDLLSPKSRASVPAGIEVKDNAFIDNISPDCDGSAGINGRGGAIFVHADSVLIEHNLFTENLGTYGGAISSWGDNTYTVRHNRFIRNHAPYDDRFGGGISGVGGAIGYYWYEYGSVNILHNTFVDNTVLSGIDFGEMSANAIQHPNARVEGNIFIGGDEGAPALAIWRPPVGWNLFHDLPDSAYYGWNPRPSDIFADPLLRDREHDDLRLREGSPAIDAARPARLDPDSSRADIGALPFLSYWIRIDEVDVARELNAQGGGSARVVLHRGPLDAPRRRHRPLPLRATWLRDGGGATLLAERRISVAELDGAPRLERTLRWRHDLPPGPGRLMIEGGGVDPVFLAGRVEESGAAEGAVGLGAPGGVELTRRR